MTENKRFKLDSEIGFIDTQKCGGDTMTLFEVVVELNKLNEENEELKENCKNYNWYKQYKTLLNENEQLKSTINTLTHDNTKMKKVLNTTKNENEHIKNTIQEAIDNERTELGKSVLKQLLNNIEAIQ